MTRSPLGDAFDHHVWATLRLMDACLTLSEEQLTTDVPGTYGPILETMRHLVDADCGYLSTITHERVPRIDAEAMQLPELRATMERNGTAWTDLLAQAPDPDEVIVRKRDDGSETHAPVGIRLAQAIHHGTDHRSQICTGLTSLGIELPLIDVWDYGENVGRTTEIGPR